MPTPSSFLFPPLLFSSLPVAQKRFQSTQTAIIFLGARAGYLAPIALAKDSAINFDRKSLPSFSTPIKSPVIEGAVGRSRSVGRGNGDTAIDVLPFSRPSQRNGEVMPPKRRRNEFT